MTICGTDPKASKEDAAQRLADLFHEYGVGRIPSSNPAAAGCIIGMFSQRWPLLRVLAHQLHDAIEAEKTKSNPTEPLVPADPPVTEKRLLDSIAKVNARATDTKAELLDKIEKQDRHFSKRTLDLTERMDRDNKRLREVWDRLDRFAIELQGKVNARPRFEEGRTYRTRKNRTAQVCNDHGDTMAKPFRIVVAGSVDWATSDGRFGDDQMLPGAIEDGI